MNSSLKTAEAAQAFLDSEVGKYLVHKADIEHTAVIHDLMDVDATDLGAVVALKVRAQVAQTCVNWLHEVIMSAQVDHDIRDSEDSGY